jgi:hypothetical protein
VGIDRDVWLKALADTGFDPAEDDQDALTLGEFATMFGMKTTTASGRLEQLVANGTATRTKKWTTNVRGHRLHLTAYRLAPKVETRKAKR